MKIKKGDKVKVTTGKFRGEEGVVSMVMRKKNKVLIDGINVKKRAIKHSESNTTGYYFKSAPLDVSNVKLIEILKDSAVNSNESKE